MRPMSNFPFVLLLAVAAVSALSAVALAQAAPTKEDTPRPELAFGYSYVQSNLPPGGCGCFGLNGGNATFTWPVGSGKFAAVGDIDVVHAGSASSSGDSLTLGTYTAGVRYLPLAGRSVWQPFGQVAELARRLLTKRRRLFPGPVSQPLGRVPGARANLCPGRQLLDGLAQRGPCLLNVRRDCLLSRSSILFTN